MKYFILAIFIITFVLIIALPKFKTYFTLGSAIVSSVALLAVGQVGILNIIKGVDLNVILTLAGIMLTVYFFSESGMPVRLAEKIISKIPDSLTAIVLLAVMSGFISAFLDNVATVLMLAPIGIAVAKKIEVSPVPVIIAIAVSSNLQGAATLVGDTTSIMLASSAYADMSFSDFFFMNGRFSIFWAVEIGAALTIPILLILFRKDKKRISISEGGTEVKSYFPTVMLLLNFALLIAASFIPDKIEQTNGIICITVGVAGLVFDSVKHGENPFKTAVKAVDYDTVLFLVFLFITVSNFGAAGLIDDVSSAFASIGTDNVFLLYTVITFGAVLFSAVIDNIPFVATMLPVISGISAALSLSFAHTRLLYFGLLCGATLGGNLTPVGASANVVGIGLLRKEDYEVKNADFFRIGIPFTLVAVLGGYAFLYLIWGL